MNIIKFSLNLNFTLKIIEMTFLNIIVLTTFCVLSSSGHPLVARSLNELAAKAPNLDGLVAAIQVLILLTLINN